MKAKEMGVTAETGNARGDVARAWKTVHVLCALMRIRPLTITEQDELHEAHLQIREALTAAQQGGGVA